MAGSVTGAGEHLADTFAFQHFSVDEPGLGELPGSIHRAVNLPLLFLYRLFNPYWPPKPEDAAALTQQAWRLIEEAKPLVKRHANFIAALVLDDAGFLFNVRGRGEFNYGCAVNAAHHFAEYVIGEVCVFTDIVTQKRKRPEPAASHDVIPGDHAMVAMCWDEVRHAPPCPVGWDDVLADIIDLARTVTWEVVRYDRCQEGRGNAAQAVPGPNSADPSLRPGEPPRLVIDGEQVFVDGREVRGVTQRWLTVLTKIRDSRSDGYARTTDNREAIREILSHPDLSSVVEQITTGKKLDPARFRLRSA